MTASDKARLRREMRASREQAAADLPESVRALVFSRPPAPVIDRIGQDAVIGLYHATSDESPTARYGQYFMEQGHRIALPRIGSGNGSNAMHFAEHTDPLGSSDLEEGVLGILQPGADAADLTPDVLFVPLVAFDAAGGRLGQGGGYYDRWMAAHPHALRIGLAWDAQCIESVPMEKHDIPLHLIVTPTRIYEAQA